jgi:hypothetical protein
VLYEVFACKDFTAERAALHPSSEPDLAKRPGCATCHATLEPMAAYFARVRESDWTFLPPEHFPTMAARCSDRDRPLPAECRGIYDPDFRVLAGAHAAPAHADAGPAGLAAELASAPELAPCVVQHVAESLLARPLTAADEPWQRELAATFVAGGYRMRALAKAIVTSDRYRAGDGSPTP